MFPAGLGFAEFDGFAVFPGFGPGVLTVSRVDRYGQERRHRPGMKSDDEVERVVDRAIAESRSEQRRR